MSTPPETRPSKRERREALQAERERRAAAARRRRVLQRVALIVLLAAVVVAVAAGVFVLTQPAAPIEGVRSVPDEGAGHVPPGQPITYKSNPPASGPHYDVPARYGFYDQPVPEGNWVHTLEHGGVVILYRCPPDNCDALKSQLREALNTFPRSNVCQPPQVKLVIAPYERLEHQVAVVAWDNILDLDQWDAQKARAFYSQFVDRGPERNVC